MLAKSAPRLATPETPLTSMAGAEPPEVISLYNKLVMPTYPEFALAASDAYYQNETSAQFDRGRYPDCRPREEADHSTLAQLGYTLFETSKDSAVGAQRPESWEGKQYFGKAFIKVISPSLQVIIVAHRGSRLIGGFTTDWWIMNKDLLYKRCAYGNEYFEQALFFLEHLRRREGDAVSRTGTFLYMTGHSMGGALAELLMYATGIPAVTFDSPGVQEIVEKQRPRFSARFTTHQQLPVTGIFLKPNCINTLNTHIGCMLRIPMPEPQEVPIATLVEFFRRNFFELGTLEPEDSAAFAHYWHAYVPRGFSDVTGLSQRILSLFKGEHLPGDLGLAVLQGIYGVLRPLYDDFCSHKMSNFLNQAQGANRYERVFEWPHTRHGAAICMKDPDSDLMPPTKICPTDLILPTEICTAEMNDFLAIATLPTAKTQHFFRFANPLRGVLKKISKFDISATRIKMLIQGRDTTPYEFKLALKSEELRLVLWKYLYHPHYQPIIQAAIALTLKDHTQSEDNVFVEWQKHLTLRGPKSIKWGERKKLPSLHKRVTITIWDPPMAHVSLTVCDDRTKMRKYLSMWPTDPIKAQIDPEPQIAKFSACYADDVRQLTRPAEKLWRFYHINWQEVATYVDAFQQKAATGSILWQILGSGMINASPVISLHNCASAVYFAFAAGFSPSQDYPFQPPQGEKIEFLGGPAFCYPMLAPEQARPAYGPPHFFSSLFKHEMQEIIRSMKVEEHKRFERTPCCTHHYDHELDHFEDKSTTQIHRMKRSGLPQP